MDERGDTDKPIAHAGSRKLGGEATDFRNLGAESGSRILDGVTLPCQAGAWPQDLWLGVGRR
jgi:hypothetical protein